IALNLIAGYGGYPAFGNVVFFGIGAYATGVAQANLHAPFAVGVAAAVILSAATALATGPLFFRLRGHYFAIGTLGLNGAVAQLVTNLPLSGGAKGLSLPIVSGSPSAIAAFFYELFLGALVVALLVSVWVERGRLGYAARALRGGEDVAQSLGVDTLRTKVALWTISAALTGSIGAVYAYFINYIEPPDVFSLGLSVKAFVIMLLGGAATVFGPLVAAFFVEGAVALTQHLSLNYDVGFLGLIVIAAVVFFPRGVSRSLRERLLARRTVKRLG
ncbi:MAG TPA: branched-chain amino acid ABC transporter permease, partial [Candidatus Elarobacter sp.]|nr:branched-chain amino acid ABC transporter permease [Candidatus Elarobacter sp.]